MLLGSRRQYSYPLTPHTLSKTHSTQCSEDALQYHKLARTPRLRAVLCERKLRSVPNETNSYTYSLNHPSLLMHLRRHLSCPAVSHTQWDEVDVHVPAP